jgi:hypothetical protein
MKIVIVALLFLVANVAAALGCLGNDRQVIAIINKVPQLFVFTKGATSVSGGASRNGKLCRLEANFNTLHAGFVCGEERKEGRLVGVNRRGSFALVFDRDDAKEVRRDADRRKGVLRRMAEIVFKFK